MPPWKPFLALVPSGLLLGLVAGQATRPVMLVKDDRPWPNAVTETAREADRWPTFDLSGPETASRGYSYRPDIDYDLYAWPDQTDRSAELLAADYDYGTPELPSDSVEDLPLTRRAVAELAGRQVERAAAGATAENPPAVVAEGAAARAEGERSAFVLPPVPPPLAQAGSLPALTDADEDQGEAF